MLHLHQAHEQTAHHLLRYRHLHHLKLLLQQVPRLRHRRLRRQRLLHDPHSQHPAHLLRRLHRHNEHLMRLHHLHHHLLRLQALRDPRLISPPLAVNLLGLVPAHCSPWTHHHTPSQTAAHQGSPAAQAKREAAVAERDSWSKITDSNSSLTKPYLCQGNSSAGRRDIERAEAAVCRWISARLPRRERDSMWKTNGIEYSRKNCLHEFETSCMAGMQRSCIPLWQRKSFQEAILARLFV